MRIPAILLISMLLSLNTIAQTTQPLTRSELNAFSKFLAGSEGIVARQNALAANSISSLAVDRKTLISQQHLFSHELDVKGISNQKSSGRCWIFAGLNILRPGVIKRYELEEFEFSQNFLMFFDKMEKANLFLNQMILLKDRELHDRELTFLLDNPIGDGGQWNMVVDLVEKYGLVPLSAMPETYASSHTSDMNMLLKKRLRKAAAQIRSNSSETSTDRIRTTTLSDVYRILALALGEPPERFEWQYESSKGKLSKPQTYTPSEFRDEFVKEDLKEYVYLLQNPTKNYYQNYTISLDRDMIERPDMAVLNLPMDDIKRQTLEAVQSGYPVWFACDVGQEQLRTDGLMVRGIYDYEALMGVDVQMTKAEQIDYGESIPTHAMVIVGVDVMDKSPRKWKVENSWGTTYGQDGYWLMDDAWFDQYMYGVILPRKVLEKKTLEALKTPANELPPWDAMYEMIRGPR